MKILLYASAVWRRGTERKVAGQRRPRSATVSAHTVRVPGAKGLVNLAEAVQNVALRLILPVWRITPIVSLQCEVSLPPVRLVLDYLRALYAIRLHALPRQHPVAVRLPAMVPAQEHRGLLQVRSRTNRGHLTMKTTPLLEMTRDVQNVERHGPGPEAPWLPTFEQQGFVTISFFEGSDKDTVAKQHNALIEAKAPTRSPCWCIQTARYRQRARQELDLSSTEPAKTHGTRPRSGHSHNAQGQMPAADLFSHSPAEKLSSGWNLTQLGPRSVHLAWVPGHKDIEGNDYADEMVASRHQSRQAMDKSCQG
ncbi:unnamed protein product [Tilletia laevis]|uniref:RNase H type-1 domain-containing protein n=1 Tax=Tilletia laevis TaxID=157183 RepID=A0A9N8QFA9_9BASI|nr:unnamed protein product [Tilletia laevis]